ncbi:MAG: HAMP domain-containing histidine kinase [Oscillospiraceae bacterium]|jgi:signal transduction histidine kinase|nr:HAMP domain-containing histidine kinase [Oscillospiraceae bacterium]
MRKRLSITARITLWYAALLLAIVALALGYLLTAGESVVQRDSQEALVNLVHNNADEIGWDDGEIEIDEDDFDFYQNGVTAVVYDEAGALLSGRLPQGFPGDAAFAPGKLQNVQGRNGAFWVYDESVKIRGFTLYVRGVLPADAASAAGAPLLRLALFALPVLVAVAALGGFLITRRAFAPVREMHRTLKAITGGQDLSRRVKAGTSKDELRDLADTVNAMLARLEAAFESEKQFVADASHELRTPVAVILAQCEYARDLPPEEAQAALAVIDRQAARMHRLIALLLSMARMERGDAAPALAETDISALTESLLNEQAALAPDGKTLTVAIAPGIRAAVDATLYARLLENLVQNAYQYGLTAVTATLAAGEGQAILRIADDGEGIPKAEQARIFRRFYRANTARTADGAMHMGLGLAIVQQIARAHGGEVHVESEMGQGSAFIFTFPMA